MLSPDSTYPRKVRAFRLRLLNAIYEQDFLEFSYGFRPRRSQHDALDEIGRAICRAQVSYVER